jgi:PHP family Zn ribbon phosphoesterase
MISLADYMKAVSKTKTQIRVDPVISMTAALKTFKTDMHIHSCLSPCGDWEMSPKKIVNASLTKGLQIIAICDHNSIENAAAIIQVGKQKGLTVIPGMEVCSREEVHILALFEELNQALAMQAFVYQNINESNQPEHFGYQVIANQIDEVIGENTRLLIGATELSLDAIITQTHEFNGLSIASHIDRPSYSIVSQLGFIPSDLALDAIEVSRRWPLENSPIVTQALDDYPVLHSSDAHYLSDIGSTHTNLVLAEPTFNEIRQALHGANGRCIEV